MATNNPALPPIAKVATICIWIETVLYGVNCIMYGLCMFILLRGRKVAILSRVLVMMSTVLFFLCTIHVGASLRQLLEAFVYAPVNAPQYSTTYWLNYASQIAVLKDYLYDNLALSQYGILIWRLYVVFMRNWKVVVIPIFLMIGLAGSIYAASAFSTVPHAGLHGPVVSALIRSAWALDITLNVSVTAAIALRLWWMGRKVATARPNRYAIPIYVVVESGAILLVPNALILGLYLSKNPASSFVFDIASQLAALAPFLIVVQVGLTSRYRIPHRTSNDASRTELTSLDGIKINTDFSEERGLGRVSDGVSHVALSRDV